MKRFTETQKWDDPWFRELAGSHKLVFLYILDRCNNAGFWEVDLAALAFHTKLEPKHFEGAFKALERGLQGASSWVWVRNFLRHQKNDELNPANPAHRQIIALLKDQAERFPDSKSLLPKGATKGLPSPIGKGKGKGKGKVWEPTPLQIRISKLLNRRESTRWSAKEIAAFEEIDEPTEDEMELMEDFYNAIIPEEKDFRRTKMETLLAHWNGEVDKARFFRLSNAPAR